MEISIFVTFWLMKEDKDFDINYSLLHFYDNFIIFNVNNIIICMQNISLIMNNANNDRI